MKEVMYQVVGMIREYKDKNNPDNIREQYKKELSKIFNKIDKELHLRYAETDGCEVGSPDDYK